MFLKVIKKSKLQSSFRVQKIYDFLELLKLACDVNQVNMAHKQCPAAIALQAELIKHFLALFAFFDTFFVLLP